MGPVDVLQTFCCPTSRSHRYDSACSAIFRSLLRARGHISWYGASEGRINAGTFHRLPETRVEEPRAHSNMSPKFDPLSRDGYLLLPILPWVTRLRWADGSVGNGVQNILVREDAQGEDRIHGEIYSVSAGPSPAASPWCPVAICT